MEITARNDSVKNDHNAKDSTFESKLYFDYINRSSCPEVFCKKGVLRNFAKLTRKHLCQSLLFNTVAGLLNIH